jgi:hypothetical protein
MNSPVSECIVFISALCILHILWGQFPLITIILVSLALGTIFLTNVKKSETTSRATATSGTTASSATASGATTSGATVLSSPKVEKPEDVTTNVINIAKQYFHEYMQRETFLDFSPTSYSTVYLIQDGVPDFWTNWVKTQVDFIASSNLNIIENTVYVIIPLNLTWFLDQHTQIANVVLDNFSIEQSQRDLIIGQEIAGQSNAYQFGAGPAWGPGNFPTFNFNLEAIHKKNLLLTDTMGMLQTPGHEFFHVVQSSSLQKKMFFLPAWFVEGSATFIGISVANKTKPVTWYTYEWARSWALNRNNELVQNNQLSQIVNNITNPETDPDPYGIGCIAVEYMIAWFGMEKFMNIYINAGNYITTNNPTTRPNDPYNPIVFEDSFFKATGVYLQSFYDSFERVRQLLGFNRTGPIIRTTIPDCPEATEDALILANSYKSTTV